MQEIVRKNPGVRAIMMGQHGFISWQDDDKRCYEETLRFIEKASQYRGEVSSQRRRCDGLRRPEIPVAR